MEEELDQLHKNETWVLISANKMKANNQTLREKWVYKIKRDINDNIAHFKARWVVKDYLQQFGVDFDQTFAAVVKPMAFRVLFTVVAYFNLDIDQMDVKTVFLYRLINHLVYMDIPKGSKSEATQGIVCKLLKVFYSLKQSPAYGMKSFQISFSKNSACQGSMYIIVFSSALLAQITLS